MQGKTHAAVGAAVGVTLAEKLAAGGCAGFEGMIAALGVSMLGALFPDLDAKNSKGEKILNKVLASVFLIGGAFMLGCCLNVIIFESFKINTVKLASFAVFLMLGVYAKTQPHRGFTHSILSAVLVSACFYGFTNKIYGIYFMFGYLSHLAIDMLNTKGMSILWPLPQRFCLSVCKADGYFNECLYYAGFFICAVLVGVRQVI